MTFKTLVSEESEIKMLTLIGAYCCISEFSVMSYIKLWSFFKCLLVKEYSTQRDDQCLCFSDTYNLVWKRTSTPRKHERWWRRRPTDMEGGDPGPDSTAAVCNPVNPPMRRCPVVECCFVHPCVVFQTDYKLLVTSTFFLAYTVPTRLFKNICLMTVPGIQRTNTTE